MTWQEWFKAMAHVNPETDQLSDLEETTMWENMYQAFKARMVEELEL